MGLKTSVGSGIAQLTRFKRRLSSLKIGTNFTPPATPFNNTSFLIRLQQRREQGASSTRLKFDQYGSMENMIACCSFATSPDNQITGLSSHSSNHSNSKPSSENADSSLENGSSVQERELLDSSAHQQTQLVKCDRASSAIRVKLGDSEEHQGDCKSKQGNDLEQFCGDNFDRSANSRACFQGSGSVMKR